MIRRSLLVTFALSISWATPFPFVPVNAAPLPATLSDQHAEDRPTKLSPKAGRTPVEEDHVKAAALFAHARVLMQRQDYAGALRRLQRAWRLDAESVPIITEIVPLAFELKRSEEAARYAIIAAERDPKDAATLIRLAAFLVDQKNVSRAAKLYEKALSLREEIPQDAGVSLLHLEMGRYYLSLIKKSEANKDKAAAAFQRVRDVIEDTSRKNVADQLRRALGNKPEILALLLGDGFLQAGRFDDAVALYRRANEAKKNDDLLAYRLARVDYEKGDTKAALEKLNQYFDANLSEAGTSAAELLEQLLRKQSFDEAATNSEMIARLEKLRSKFSSNVPLNFCLAEQYRKAKKYDKAESIYLELLKRQAAIDVYQGILDLYLKQGQHEKLLGMLGQAVAKTNALEALGDIVDEITENAELMDKLIQLARKQKDEKPSVLADGVAWSIAQMAIDAERYDVAEEFFEAALTAAGASKPQIMVGYGLKLFTTEQGERAAKIFRRAIDEKVLPENNQAFYYYLAGALALNGKDVEALDAAKKAIAAGPKSARFQSRAAWIPYHAKQYSVAEKGYLDLLKEFDSDYSTPDVRETMRETRLILSNICVHLKRMPEAEEWLEQVLDEFPEDIGAANDLGYLWADQDKNVHRALGMAQRAVESEPKNKAYRDTLGWVYYRLERFSDAVRELSLAAETEDPDGVIMDHLGDAYAGLKQKEKAIESWRKAADSFKQEKEVDKLQAVEEKIKKLQGK